MVIMIGRGFEAWFRKLTDDCLVILGPDGEHGKGTRS